MSKLKIITRENCWLRYDEWVIAPAVAKISERGYNLLHFNSKNRPYVNNKSAKDFAQDELEGAEELESDSETLLFAIQKAKVLNGKKSNGLFLEFGFCTGKSINFIAALAYDKEIWGFDSGEGLPEPWERGGGYLQGTFAYKSKDPTRMPFCPLDNTKLVIGQIKDTLPIFVEEIIKGKSKVIDFIHIDTDLQSTANIIYNQLSDFIVPDKTVIVLDEGYNFSRVGEVNAYNEWQFHEFKATNDFKEEKNYDIKYLAYNINHQQLVFTFTNK